MAERLLRRRADAEAADREAIGTEEATADDVEPETTGRTTVRALA